MSLISRLISVIASLMLPNLLLAIVALTGDASGSFGFFGGLGAIGIISNLYLWRRITVVEIGEYQNVTSIKRFNFDFFSHIISYIPAILALSIDTEQLGISLIVFYIFYMIVLALSDIVILNPIQRIFGWRYLPATIKYPKGDEEVIIAVGPTQQLLLGEQLLAELTEFGFYRLCDEENEIK